MKEFFVKIGTSIKGAFTKIGTKLSNTFNYYFKQGGFKYSARKYKCLTALQARETFEFSKATQAKDRVIKIVSPIIKFIVVFAVAYVILFVQSIFTIIQTNKVLHLYVFFTLLMFVLQTLSCMISTTKNYYLAEDNKVLITFPSSGSTLFLSKLTIEFLKELKNAAFFYLPISLAILFFGTGANVAQFAIISVIWSIIPCIILVAIEVLLGSLLSVLWLAFLRLIKKVPIIETILILAAAAGIVYLAVYLINLIPGEGQLVLMNTWKDIKSGMNNFLYDFATALTPVMWFCSIIVGKTDLSHFGYRLDGASFGKFGLLLLILIGLFILVFLIIKKLFLHMMTKTNDYEKVKENSHDKNHVHSVNSTFVFKELKMSFRTIEVSGAYLITYIAIPILILLLCKIFNGMELSEKGDALAIVFCVLLIILPLLAANTSLASAYSREGRAGYIKKTKPVNPIIPLISKLVFNLILTIPSLAVSGWIFGKYTRIDTASAVIITIAILFMQFGHIFFSSTLDVTKPKNERYATEGENYKNGNEAIATVVAFAMAAIFTVLVYFFFNESRNLFQETYVKASLKMLFIGLAVFGSSLLLYILKVKAFFVEK